MSKHINNNTSHPEIQLEKEEKEAFRLRWKRITHVLKTSGYDFSKVELTKGK